MNRTFKEAKVQRYHYDSHNQTEPNITSFAGPDYLDHPADNFVDNHGPVMDLTR